MANGLLYDHQILLSMLVLLPTFTLGSKYLLPAKKVKFLTLNISATDTEDPRYNNSVCYQRFCCKIEFSVIKKRDRTQLKHE